MGELVFCFWPSTVFQPQTPTTPKTLSSVVGKNKEYALTSSLWLTMQQRLNLTFLAHHKMKPNLVQACHQTLLQTLARPWIAQSANPTLTVYRIRVWEWNYFGSTLLSGFSLTCWNLHRWVSLMELPLQSSGNIEVILDFRKFLGPLEQLFLVLLQASEIKLRRFHVP